MMPYERPQRRTPATTLELREAVLQRLPGVRREAVRKRQRRRPPGKR